MGNFNKAALVVLTLLLSFLQLHKLPPVHYIVFIWLAVMIGSAGGGGDVDGFAVAVGVDFAVDVGVDVVVFVHVIVAAVIGGVVVGGVVVVIAIIRSVKISAFIAVCSRLGSLLGVLVPGVVFASLQLNSTWACLEDVLVLV